MYQLVHHPAGNRAPHHPSPGTNRNGDKAGARRPGTTSGADPLQLVALPGPYPQWCGSASGSRSRRWSSGQDWRTASAPGRPQASAGAGRCFGRADARTAADVGAHMQTLLLAMAAYGVDSCPQGLLSFYADTVRGELGVIEGRLLVGVSFGYADGTAPVNRVRAGRAALATTTTFHG
ncbi:nitroreductase family protein [Streptomyces klenkii]|uniref:nitroreductase family protein n=1 Tax=Streptomyces klenkii TaxID=1420899 RepID=UPI003F4B29B7